MKRYLLFLLPLLVACGMQPQLETDTTAGSGNQSEEISLSVSPLTINAPHEGGTFEVRVRSNTRWTTETDASWLTRDLGMGRNNGTVTLTVAPATNETPTTAHLTVRPVENIHADKAAVVTVVRAGKADSGNQDTHCFMVGNGKKVVFSSGNLQYMASDNSWRFAPQQYAYTGIDNKNISASYSGYIDLFGWGTSGSKGRMPYLATTDIDLYGTEADLTGESAVYDWGANSSKITNSPDKDLKWRTLTKEEWQYLLQHTDYSLATVCGTAGLLLFPEGFDMPAGITCQQSYSSYTANTYTDEQWSALEKAGAVFLPAAGWRSPIADTSGEKVHEAGMAGLYWTASVGGDTKNACYLNFQEDDSDMKIVVMSDMKRYYGMAVRLVRDVE